MVVLGGPGLDSGLQELLGLASSFLGPPGAYGLDSCPLGVRWDSWGGLPPGQDSGFLVLSGASWS